MFLKKNCDVTVQVLKLLNFTTRSTKDSQSTQGCIDRYCPAKEHKASCSSILSALLPLCKRDWPRVPCENLGAFVVKK